MTSPHEDVAKRQIWLRPARALPLFGGGLSFLVGLYMMMFSPAADWLTYAMGLGGMIGGVGLIVNYGWFHYLVINERELKRVRYLGLDRTIVPIREISDVTAKRGETVWGKPIPLVCIRWPNGVIKLNPQSYWTKSLRAVVSHLRNMGVPVEAELARDLGLK
jgi:hypothetical protein